MSDETTQTVDRATALANYAARTGVSLEQADRQLTSLVDWHEVSGTVPEALWRAGFCRPADSRALAAVLGGGDRG